MKLQTTYPSNNYPIYVEHGAIDRVARILMSLIKVLY